MLYLLWSLLNAIVIIYGFYLVIGFLIKGKRIFKPPFKTVSIIIFVIAVSQLFFATKSKKIDNQIALTENYNPDRIEKTEHIVLEENTTFDINILLSYTKKENEYIPVESNSFLTGLVSGLKWQIVHVKVNRNETNNTSQYHAEGTLHWHLFGIKIYSESKSFTGIIE